MPLRWQVDSELLDDQGNSILHSSEGSQHAQTTFKERSYSFPPKSRVSQVLFGILLHGRFISSPTFINLFIISMALWVSYTVGQMPCYFICCFTQIAPGLATRILFS